MYNVRYIKLIEVLLKSFQYGPFRLQKILRIYIRNGGWIIGLSSILVLIIVFTLIIWRRKKVIIR